MLKKKNKYDNVIVPCTDKLSCAATFAQWVTCMRLEQMWLEVRTIPFSPQRRICGVWMRVQLALPNKQMRKKEMVLPLMDDFVCVCVTR